MENTNREGFGSNFGFIMAAVGSAVGLGNIWGFPYKMGLNGGFAFLLIYLVLAAFIGLAVMVGELAIGRSTGMSPIAAYRKISKKFTWLGYMAVLCPFLILCFYMVLGGMVMRYACSYLLAMFGVDIWGVKDISTFFGTFLLDGTQMIIWTVVFIAINTIIVCGGIGGGIEKFCNIGMPCLFVMLIVIIVYVAVQPGAMGGYQFMFGLNIDPLKNDFLGVLKTAAGQMFFSLSLGMGAIITYGSYLSKKESIQKNAVIVVVMDTLVAIMAGSSSLPCRWYSTTWAASSVTSWASCSTSSFSSQQSPPPCPCLRRSPPPRSTPTSQRARLPREEPPLSYLQSSFSSSACPPHLTVSAVAPQMAHGFPLRASCSELRIPPAGAQTGLTSTTCSPKAS